MIAGQVTKKYAALVHGCPASPDGLIDGPIDRDPLEPHRRIVTPSGYPALTYYKVSACYGLGALVELRLGTGRTHQIRVHMTSIGHPLIGDKLYTWSTAQGTEGQNMSASVLDAAIGRQALHAAELGFRHPLTGEDLLFRAPLPPDMETLRRKLEYGE